MIRQFYGKINKSICMCINEYTDVCRHVYIYPFGSNSWHLLALAYNAATGDDRTIEGNL